MFMSLKLEIELVPKTCWFSNIRDHVTASQWTTIKKRTFALAGHRCEICSGVGPKWPVECHEIWIYNDQLKTQTLERTIALCPSCHQVKHIGFASVLGTFEVAKAHFAKVNQISKKEAAVYIDKAFKTFHKRSQSKWTLHIDWLEKEFGFKISEKR